MTTNLREVIETIIDPRVLQLSKHELDAIHKLLVNAGWTPSQPEEPPSISVALNIMPVCTCGMIMVRDPDNQFYTCITTDCENKNKRWETPKVKMFLYQPKEKP